MPSGLSQECNKNFIIKPSSVIAVQGLGADKYYTWVKKKSSAVQQEKSKPLSRLGSIRRRCKVAQTPESNDAARTGNNTSEEVMWLRNLLPRFLPNVRSHRNLQLRPASIFPSFGDQSDF